MDLIRQRAAVITLFVLAGSAAAVYWMRPPARPRYIFINETSHHEHDLALKMSLKLAEQRAGIENALILLKNLPPGESIEQVAVDLFRKWKIGGSRSGRGVLFLYSEQENLFKIEVSYSLEPVFPDALCRRMEEAAQTYMLSEIPQDFLSELLITMNLRAKDAAGEGGAISPRPEWITGAFLSGGAGVKAQGYRRTLADIESAVQSLPKSDLDTYGPSNSANETVLRYLRSLKLGIGDPRLPLLTEGSRVFRAVVPRNPDQQKRVYDYYEKAEPARLIFAGALGLAVFRPGVANLPIVLRRAADGRWFVDEPKAWTYFHRFEDRIDFFPKYGDLPFIAGLKTLGCPHAGDALFNYRVRTPTPPSYPFALQNAVADLERRVKLQPRDDQAWAALGELYLFEMDWLSRALYCFEQAAKLAPERLDYRWRLWDLYLNDSRMEEGLATLKFLAQRLPHDEETQRWYRFYRAAYDFKAGEFPAPHPS